MQLTFSNGRLFQPFSVEMRLLLGIVITRLPRIHGVYMAGAHRARAVVSFVLSEVLEGDVVKNESEDELPGRHLSWLQGEQYRLHNY